MESKNSLSYLHDISQKTVDPLRINLSNLSAGASRFFSLAKVKDLENRVFTLEVENANLQSKIARYKNVEEENIKIRRLLDSGLPGNWKFAPAHVISKLGDEMYLYSDIKTANNIPVITNQEKYGVYLGKVARAVGNQLQVILIGSPEIKLPVIVQDSESQVQTASGILVGRGGKSVLEQVLSGEELKEGSIILTSGEGTSPRGLLVGYVGKLISGKNSALQQAEVVQVIDAEKLDVVFLVVNF